MQVHDALFRGPFSLFAHIKKPASSSFTDRLASRLWMGVVNDLENINISLCKKFLAQPILPRYITVPSKNIVNGAALGLCLLAVDRPVKKQALESFAKEEGFSITQDVILNPSSISGRLCVGMGIQFLFTYLNSSKGPEQGIKEAAEVLRDGATQGALSAQLLYEALMPIIIPQPELDEWAQRLVNPKYKLNIPLTAEKEALLKTLDAFFNPGNPEKSLRKFVLQSMAPISKELYAIVLYLDLVHSKTNPHLLHCDVKQAVLNHYGLKIDKTKVTFGDSAASCEKLPPGAYFLEMPQHEVVFIKLANGKSALFDPLVGTAFLNSPKEEKDCLTHLLQHYQVKQFPIVPVVKA